MSPSLLPGELEASEQAVLLPRWSRRWTDSSPSKRRGKSKTDWAVWAAHSSESSGLYCIFKVAQIKEACRRTCETLKLPPDYIQFVFIVVTKKVNVRILQHAGAGYVNPYPGTIVDSVVTRPER